MPNRKDNLRKGFGPFVNPLSPKKANVTVTDVKVLNLMLWQKRALGANGRS